jgi:CheY-like chemotaxis protein
VEDIEGEIYVESQVGVGSIFTVVLKLKKPLLDEALGSEELILISNGHKFIQSPSAPTAPKVVEQTADTTSAYKSRILLVEDNSMAAQIVINKLSALHCIVDWAENGKRAVQLAEENQYDLIFMDIGLPDIDGYEVTKRIRLSELNKPHVPIIALSAHAGDDSKKQCTDIGMNAVLTKPLTEEKAEDVLNAFIPHRQNKLDVANTAQSLEETVENNALSIFDFEELVKQTGGKKEVAIEFITTFLAESPAEVRQIAEAHERQDWTAVKNTTHKFHGGVSYCAAARLRNACRNLESAIKSGKTELFENLYNELLREISLAEKTMKEELARGKA